jgi:aryl-alcohol dehydrogenase-like predicted oxidoreductase
MSLLDKQIGLGTFPFSNVFSEVTQQDAEDVVKEFVNLGGKYLETAPKYPRGNVDFSRIVKLFNREDLYIGTKCVLYLDETGATASSGKPHAIVTQCQNELKRIGVDYIDLLEAHVTATDVEPCDVARTLNDLKQKGLVRYIGVSNASPSDMQSYVQSGAIDFVQNRYSVIHRNSTECITDICAEHGILFNPYQVIERGQLITRASNAGEWREGDLRASKAEYVGDAFSRVHDWVTCTLGNLASNAGLSLEALSIGWVFSRAQVSMPVIGATKVWQVKNNMQSGIEPLPDNLLSEIDSVYLAFLNEIQSVFGLTIEEFRGLA